jgi:hypothetical protein
MSDALQTRPETRSATGKPLSGANARRRKQAARRLAMLGPATYGFWVRRDSTPGSQEAFNRLRAALIGRWDDGLDPRVMTIPVLYYMPQYMDTISSD